MDAQHAPGDLVRDRYRIVAVLGRGGAGTTYEAEDLAEGKRVALKQLDVRRLEDWKHHELFEREARILRHLVHPAIPRYVDSFELDDERGPHLVLVQELAPGKNLAELVASGFRPDEAELRRIAAQVLTILGYLQSLMPPVVHRDVTPRNLIRADDGAISLVDFGAVRGAIEDGAASTVVGTYGYMAPEQLQGRATKATDLYGLAATLVFLATGKSPSELPHDKLRLDVRASISSSPQLAAWLSKCLEPAPEDRFASAREAAIALERGLSAPRSRARPWVPILAASAAVAAMCGLAAWRLHSLRSAARVAPKPASPLTHEMGARPLRVLSAHWSAVFSVAFSPDGKLLATGSNDDTLKLWDPSTGKVVRALPTRGARVAAVAFTHDGRALISGSGASIDLWNPATGERIRTLAGHTGPVTALAVAPSDDTIASASLDGTVRVWDRASGEARRVLRPGGRVFAVAIGSDGNTLVSGGDDGLVRIWDLATGNERRTLRHGATIDAIAIEPDGETLVSTGDDHTAKVWLLDRGELMRSFDAHRDEVWCASLQPDGRTVATSGKDGVVQLWDVYSGEVRRSFLADSRGVLAMATSPDGRVLATGAGSNLVELWAVEPGDAPRGASDAHAPQPDPDVADRKGWDPLHTAAWDGDLEKVKSLLAGGTAVDVRNARGRTPLYNAAKAGHLEVARYLLDHGADANANAARGLTPMWVAVQNHHPDVVDLLVARGADVHHKTDIGQTFVYKAAEVGDAAIAKRLIAAGATINDVDAFHWMPLGIASLRGHTDVVGVLLAQPGIDLSITTGKKRVPPLVWAAARGYEAIARMLLEKGVDVDAKDADGFTALAWAEHTQHRTIAALLREHGAK